MTAAGDTRRAARPHCRPSPPTAELQAVVRHAGVPVMLVYPSTCRILEVSDTAAATIGLNRSQLLDGPLDPVTLDDTAMSLLRPASTVTRPARASAAGTVSRSPLTWSLAVDADASTTHSANQAWSSGH